MSELIKSVDTSSLEFQKVWDDTIDLFYVFLHKKTVPRRRRKIIQSISKIYKCKFEFAKKWFTQAETAIRLTNFTDANNFHANVKTLLFNRIVELSYRK